MDYSTGEQPDASVPPEGSSSGPQAQQQQQQQQQRVSIHKPFTQSRVPPDLPHAPRPTTHHRGGAAGAGGLFAPLEERGGERHQGYKHTCMRAYAYTDTDTFLFPVALGFVHLHVSVWCVSDLQASISRIHRTIELMYSDKSMMQVRRFFRSF